MNNDKENNSKGQVIAYIRVSSIQQSEQRQISEIEQRIGDKLDKVFKEKISGKSLDRPQLQALLQYVREGDTVVITSIDRISRSLIDFLKLVDHFKAQGIILKSLDEGLTIGAAENATSELQMNVLAAVAQFERRIIRERQQAGYEAKRLAGLPLGKPKALTETQVTEIRDKVKLGISKARLSREYGVSYSTITRCLDEKYEGRKE